MIKDLNEWSHSSCSWFGKAKQFLLVYIDILGQPNHIKIPEGIWGGGVVICKIIRKFMKKALKGVHL